ncbi:hypothetical protein NNJEOMEG_01455 [Fundidesulfovibrio magnetotacticus]|uniref:Phospholipid/glycerol acyltransferase domain-containing protein n=1 Tax=Fundidesulfovibrio magnetotacticus TaxID=2730080 RepID=A0A6V8LSR0_9BACT|nr:GNAT family N-acyltransferase [Fundidesulfovibrio magnetotacticus]GFK93621.1 hypothetical protein NNJEOMEG_01455 [Fundidesulfovibrio magnetotacticus]
MEPGTPARRADFLALDGAVKNPFARTVLKAVGGPLRRALALDRLAKAYESVPRGGTPVEFLRGVIDAFGFRYRVSGEELARIPSTGPVVVVANHPFGGMEGVILTEMLAGVRPDVKVMANYLLGRIEELRDLFILVDPFGASGAWARNVAPLRQSVAWLRGGGCLGVFPAGEVAHFRMDERRVADPAWSPSVARMVRACGATVVPVHFAGANGPMFHLAGLVHPRLRTMLLGREFVNKARKEVEVRIGRPVPPQALEGLTDEQAAGHLRLCAEVMGRTRPRALPARFPLRGVRRQEALAPAQDPELMERELERLPAECLLLESGGMRAYEARAAQIPLILREIGRLREMTFRKVGEGTGKSCDLDGFDGHYSHVFLWSVSAREVVGAYRLGRSDEILATRGRSGLYVDTLFKLKPGFLTRLGPALEMGRSFVRPEHQKSYNALLLLWRGIGTVVAREPRYRTLFGPVSITNDYQAASRQLMADFFEARGGEGSGLSRLVKPRTPLRGAAWLKRAARSLVADVDRLSELVSSMEADRKGIPVLLRQYLKLGGKLLAFNVDREFSDALDGLIVVDLLETERRQLERYLGRDGLAGFLAHHGAEGGLRSA